MSSEFPPSHAGGVVYRPSPGGPEYLIVRARRDPRAWVLPKGHIEPGESAEQAAVREVEEETGCVAAVVAPLGRLEFGNVRTVVYLMRFEREGSPTESREVFWGSEEEVRDRLTFEDTRELVGHAHVRLTAGQRRSS